MSDDRVIELEGKLDTALEALDTIFYSWWEVDSYESKGHESVVAMVKIANKALDQIRNCEHGPDDIYDGD